jgi:hypothetical protein
MLILRNKQLNQLTTMLMMGQTSKLVNQLYTMMRLAIQQLMKQQLM